MFTVETASGYEPALDERRYGAAEPIGDSPPSFFVSSYRKVPVYAQQGPTCVGNSAVTGMTHRTFQESGEVVAFDGESLNARATRGYATPTSFGAVLDELRRGGISPLGDEGVYFIEGYAGVDYRNLAAIKAAMSVPGQFVLFATQVTTAMAHGTNPTQPQPPGVRDPAEMLHAVMAVGYEPNGLWLVNNYGRFWGDDGHMLLSWEYVLAHFVDMVAVTDKPDVAGGYIKTHQYGEGAEEAIKHVGNRPATYLVKPDGRIWITDPVQAKRFGVKLPAREVPDTDPRWLLPVIGPDAPKHLR